MLRYKLSSQNPNFMLWQETTDSENVTVSDDVQDLSFKFICAELPVDHAWQLAEAIKSALPWIESETKAAIHSIHGAASGNGWSRPVEHADDHLQLSKRTRFYLRLPNNRMEESLSLCGKTLQLGNYQILFGDAQPRKLYPSTTVFSRSVCSENVEREEKFIKEIVETLKSRGIPITKLLCGLSHTIRRPQGNLRARSVLLADLNLAQAIELQQHGLGNQLLLGCGIFLPHKSLAAVGSSQE